MCVYVQTYIYIYTQIHIINLVLLKDIIEKWEENKKINLLREKLSQMTVGHSTSRGTDALYHRKPEAMLQNAAFSFSFSLLFSSAFFFCLFSFFKTESYFVAQYGPEMGLQKYSNILLFLHILNNGTI